MCGIAGIVRFDFSSIDLENLTAMSKSLKQRGSDDLGFLGWSGTTPAKISRNPEAIKDSRICL